MILKIKVNYGDNYIFKRKKIFWCMEFFIRAEASNPAEKPPTHSKKTARA